MPIQGWWPVLPNADEPLMNGWAMNRLSSSPPVQRANLPSMHHSYDQRQQQQHSNSSDSLPPMYNSWLELYRADVPPPGMPLDQNARQQIDTCRHVIPLGSPPQLAGGIKHVGTMGVRQSVPFLVAWMPICERWCQSL